MSRRVPTRVKRLRGTLRRDRLNLREPTAQLGLPRTNPRWPEGKRRHYQRVRRVLAPMRVATVADGVAAEQLAEDLALAEQMAHVITTDGATYDATTQSGAILRRARPEIAILADARRRIVAMLDRFGMTPASRSKVEALPPERAGADPMERLLANRERTAAQRGSKWGGILP